MASFLSYLVTAMALDPIHVGTGGARISRVDLPIVRDPATRIPKIPGSSLAGVYRAYVAMAMEEDYQRNNPSSTPRYYPNCAGLGQPTTSGQGGHCGQHDCPVCTVFGFARGTGQNSSGFAGLAAFSDAHILFFPVPTAQGPQWVTSPLASSILTPYRGRKLSVQDGRKTETNLGWLKLSVSTLSANDLHKPVNLNVPEEIEKSLYVIPDRFFPLIVNSNLEVRTSVSINPVTGAAEEGALFTYEAIPRFTILAWEITVKNPIHFKVNNNPITAIFKDKENSERIVASAEDVKCVAEHAHDYLEYLGIGGMATRGFGRIRVLSVVERKAGNAS